MQQKSIEDCYFYYYSTCSKNDACPFRHCEKALGNEIVCKNWLNKSCTNFDCPNRHMLITKNRSTIPCYWESTPIGCQKLHCPFFHRSKANIDETISQKAQTITSTTTQQQQQQPTQSPPPATPSLQSQTTNTTQRVVVSNTTINSTNSDDNKTDLTSTIVNKSTIPCLVSEVIVPIANEDEESDDESNNSNSPKKISNVNIKNRKTKREFVKETLDSIKNLPKLISIKKSNVETPELKLEVKTLDEIRKEKAALKSGEIGASDDRVVTTSTTTTPSDSVKIDQRRIKFTESVQQNNETKISRIKSIDKKIDALKTVKAILSVEPLQSQQITTTSGATTVTSIDVTTNKFPKKTLVSSPVAIVTPQSINIAVDDVKSLKIKTLEEIKAEKEMKKKIQEEQLKQKQQVNGKKSTNETTITTNIDQHQQKQTTNIESNLPVSSSTSSSSSNETRRLRLTKPKTTIDKQVLPQNEKILTIESEQISVNCENKRKLSETIENTSVVEYVSNTAKTTSSVIIAETTSNINTIATTNNNDKIDTLNDNNNRKKLKTLNNDEKSAVELNIKIDSTKQNIEVIEKQQINNDAKQQQQQQLQDNNNIKKVERGESIEPVIFNEFNQELDKLLMLCEDEEIL